MHQNSKNKVRILCYQKLDTPNLVKRKIVLMVLYHKLSPQINSLKNKKLRYGWYSISNYYSINLFKKIGWKCLISIYNWSVFLGQDHKVWLFQIIKFENIVSLNRRSKVQMIWHQNTWCYKFFKIHKSGNGWNFINSLSKTKLRQK